MPSKRQRPSAKRVAGIPPSVKPLLKPLVEPVLTRLDRHEELLEELRAALDVQFKRTATIQAQLDQVLATLTKRER